MTQKEKNKIKEFTVVVIAFNRPNSLQRLLNSLDKVDWENDNVRLYISIDKEEAESENYKKTIQIAQSFLWNHGEKIVDCKKENLGLKQHVLQCGNLTNQYENLIVLEDDIVVSPIVYIYAKQVVNFYEGDENIAGFGLYSFQRNPANNLPFVPLNEGTDVYFMQYACSWGQIWTKERWNNFLTWYENNKNINIDKLNIPDNIKKWGEKSWLKFHTIYTILNNKFFVYPYVGLTTNFSETGIHNKINSFAYQCTLYTTSKEKVKFRYANLYNANNVYDAYFENIKINKLINIDEKIESDIYANKNIVCLNESKYLLSTRIYNYKILEKYGLQMYPYEQNIIYNIEGNDIFLYDLSKKEKNKIKKSDFILHRYLYKLDLLSKKDIIKIMKYFLQNVWESIKRKFRIRTKNKRKK